jgi:16S rRNA (uracil1498-N3)-methyltransferase
MITLLIDPGPHALNGVVSLPKQEAHHLRVRRGRAGEEVELRDGEGWVGRAVVVGDPGDGKVQVIRSETRLRPAPLVLAVGSGDRERFLWLAEKATELGVTDLIPLEAELAAGVSTRVRGQHVEKLQRRTLEAVKQSGAAWATVVHLPHTIPELLARHPVETRWLADAAGSAPPVRGHDAGLMVAIGPEGGFTPAEHELLIHEGFLPVCVGPHTLRFETAAIAAAVLGRASAKEATHD